MRGTVAPQLAEVYPQFAQRVFGVTVAQASASSARLFLRFFRQLRAPVAALRSIESADIASSTTARDHQRGAIGRCTKIRQLPFDMISDWRRLISKIGAMTSPSTSGAGSKPNFFST